MSVSRVLVSAALAGAVALSAAVGPAFLPASLGGASARAEVVVSIDVFQQELSPYGQWATVPGYGEAWYPSGVRQGWRPYYDDGHWAYSDDYGWMWVSDLPWGWAPFHYGRWAFAAPYGWIWVPGRTWGPAWVTFREAPGYIGWAPLPPEAVWDPGYGFSRPYDVGDPDYWCFVRPEGFLAPRFDRYAYDRHDYPRIINNTTNITNITVVNNRIVNRSFTVNQIEQVTHKRVERVKVTEAQHPQAAALSKGNRLAVYKPAIDGNAGAKAAPGNPNQTRQLRNLEQINPAAGGANLQSQGSVGKKARDNQLRSLQPQSLQKGNEQVPALQQQLQPQGNTRQKQQFQQLQQQVQPQATTRKKQQLQQLQQQQQQVQPQGNTRKKQQQFQQLQQQAQPQASTRKKQQLQQLQQQQFQPQSTKQSRQLKQLRQQQRQFQQQQAPQVQQQVPVQGQPGKSRKAQCPAGMVCK
jgi:DNA segregation ATPase FtsK/SpoIIIE-like protein